MGSAPTRRLVRPLGSPGPPTHAGCAPDAAITGQSCVFLAMCGEIARRTGASRRARPPSSRRMALTATAHSHGPARDLVLDTLREHAASLLGTARRYSICADDAHDAYQRAVEIFLKRAHRLDRDGALEEDLDRPLVGIV